jgi:hypothetical protein
LVNREPLLQTVAKLKREKKSVAWFKMEEEDWEMLKVAIQMLSPFKVLQKLLEGSAYPTLSLAPSTLTLLVRQLYLFYHECCGADRSSAQFSARFSVKRLLRGIIERFESHVGLATAAEREDWMVYCRLPSEKNLSVTVSDSALVAAFLDPRCKALKFLPKSLRVKAEELVRKELLSTLEKEEGPEQTPMDAATVQQHSNGKKSWTTNMCGYGEMMVGSDSEEENEGGSAVAASITRGVQILTELDYFKKLAPLAPDATGEQVLEWWRGHDKSNRLRLLCKLARKYLAMQATSAASERVFSAGGNTVTAKRYSLGDDLAATLVTLHGAIDSVAKIDPTTQRPEILRTSSASKIGVRGPQQRTSKK